MWTRAPTSCTPYQCVHDTSHVLIIILYNVFAWQTCMSAGVFLSGTREAGLAMVWKCMFASMSREPEMLLSLCLCKPPECAAQPRCSNMFDFGGACFSGSLFS